MNYKEIKNTEDLQTVLNEKILITGNINQQKEELYFNTHELAFDQYFIRTLSITDLNDFLTKLLENRSAQVTQANKGPATFYLWYDEQYLTLCFDVLSGDHIKLPFGFKLNIQKESFSILAKFYKDALDDNNYLNWENITIINPGDPEWDDNQDEDVSNYILDVFVITLPQ